MPVYRFTILGAGWILWGAPFLRFKRPRTPATLDRRARWGMVIQGVAYFVVWFGPFWLRTTPSWQVALATPFFVAGDLIVWGATRALGRHWRIDAGLDPDHELVRSGPYRVVRHPIYASMMCMLIATGLAIATLPQVAAGLVIFVIGIEIRVRVEDGLLSARFGGQFREYQRSVAAYLPWVR